MLLANIVSESEHVITHYELFCKEHAREHLNAFENVNTTYGQSLK